MENPICENKVWYASGGKGHEYIRADRCQISGGKTHIHIPGNTQLPNDCDVSVRSVFVHIIDSLRVGKSSGSIVVSNFDDCGGLRTECIRIAWIRKHNIE